MEGEHPVTSVDKKQKTSKSRGVTAVQGTNDSSSVSKCSMSTCGYLNDRFLHYFVCKQMRRTPLINRGYFIRAATIQFIIKRFLEQHRHLDQGKKQIISLGAGFDATYFHLQSCDLLGDTVYFEVDFPDVVRRKRDLIYSHQTLSDLISGISPDSHPDFPHIEINGTAYKLLGVDLTQLRCLQSILKACGVDFSIPTLVLSEVVLTYMNKQRASAIIRWTAKTFPSAVFVMYEQINPHDAFGLFMQKHFKNIGSRLKCLQAFPTLKSQEERFMKLGWPRCEALDMNQYYYTMLSTEERHRVNSLEPFDEYEGWHAKCSHYFVLCAYKGSVTPLLSDLVQAREALSLQTLEQFPYTGEAQIMCGEPEVRVSVYVYAHQSVALRNGLVLTVGGFGEQNGKHCRLSHMILTDQLTLESKVVVPNQLDEQTQAHCMYSSIVSLKDDSILLIYGRLSPAKPYPHVVRISVIWSKDQRTEETKINDNRCATLAAGGESGDGGDYHCGLVTCSDCDVTGDGGVKSYLQCVTCMVLQQSGDIPCTRWRHTCSTVNISGEEKVMLYGGRNQNEMALGDCFLLDPSSGVWSQLSPSEDGPGQIQSHTACVWNNSIFITGGLDIDLRPQNSVFLFDTISLTWAQFSIKGVLSPRYSHTAHVINCYLILIGGSNMNHFPPGIAVIHIPSGICQEFPFPECEEGDFIMLYGHTSIFLDHEKFLIIGGGGNCFSFGTHLNKSPFVIDITDCLVEINGICNY